MDIKYAEANDIEGIIVHDKHISQGNLLKAISDKHVYVSMNSEIIFGFVRYNLFWDNTPFLNMLYVPIGYNRMGVGSDLLEFWELDMKNLGYTKLLTSTQANESGQHFFRKRGYKDCGNLLMPGDELELILIKQV